MPEKTDKKKKKASRGPDKSYGLVLLAEDDKFLSRAYKDGLERAGFTVIAAYDGAQALDKARSEKPDLILLDLIMPIKDGFQVLEELGLEEELNTIPVVILSNLGQESDIQKATKLGASEYMVKTDSSMKQVVETVRQYFAQKKISEKK